MIITNRFLPRRTVLRGLGATIALPLFDAMVPAHAAMRNIAANPIQRFGAFYVPMGINMAQWTPTSEGPLEITPILTPVESFKDRLLVLSGLNSREAMSNDNGPHPRAQTTWLTGTRPRRTEGVDVHAGVSMDQVAAQAFGRQTQLSSLELAFEAVGTLNANCGTYGYACVYNNTVSWRTPTMPLPMEMHPRAVFERLFGGSDTTDAKARMQQIEKERSLLDAVTDKIARLESRLGARDRAKLTEYLDSVREVERRIQKAEEQVDLELPVVDHPRGVPALMEEHARIMFDLLALAYQSDLTRVATVMYGRESTLRTFPEIGVPESWHPLSHHQRDPVKLAKQAKLNTFHMKLFASFLERLASIPEGDGSLLDSTTFLYGSGMSDSDLHYPLDLPVLVVGGRTAGIRGGRHVKYEKGTPLANLQLTLLHKLGVPADHFGDSNNELTDI